MNYRVLTTTWFDREVKRLSKKYPSLKKDITLFREELIQNVHGGRSLGGGAFKWRLAVKSKGKGKSGGMRVITYLEVDIILKDISNIFFLSIYDKSEVGSISSDEIKRRVKSVRTR